MKTKLLNYLLKIGWARGVFFLLVFLIPIQARKIFFTENSFYFAYHSFYNTFYLYLTDVLIFIVIAIWLIAALSRNGAQIINKIYTKVAQDRIYQILGLFWVILVISALFSRPPWLETGENMLSWYGVGKYSEFFLLFAFVRENFLFSREKSLLFWIFSVSAWLQSALALYQYVFQRSIGLRILGEEFLRPGLPGVAEFFSRETFSPALYSVFPYLHSFQDFAINIRAYGTFPHPNVLAGFLAIAFFINLYLLHQALANDSEKGRGVLAFGLVLLNAGLVVSFSRVAWAAVALGLLVWFGYIFLRARKQEIYQMKSGQRFASPRLYRPRRMLMIGAVLVVALFINVVLFGRPIYDRLTGFALSPDAVTRVSEDFSEAESFEQRQLFNDLAWAMLKANPLLGVGVRNFVVSIDEFAGKAGIQSEQGRVLPYLHQPAHNIFLLVLAEAGVAAGVVFIVFLASVVRQLLRNKKQPLMRLTFFSIFVVLIFAGLFDHYWLSIQQGALVFWIFLGLISEGLKSNNSS